MSVGAWFERAAAAGCVAVRVVRVVVVEGVGATVGGGVGVRGGELVGVGLGVGVRVGGGGGVVAGVAADVCTACVGVEAVGLCVVGDGWGRGWVQPCAYWLYSKFMPSSFMLHGSAL